MSESLLMLRLEHRNIEGLLDCLQHQLDLLKSGEQASPTLLGLAIDYFEHFPDQCHHPKEDLIFQRLQKRNPSLAEELGDLEEDHHRLSDTTRKLAAAFRHPQDAMPLDEILQEFVDSYRRHMEAEETRFFPAAQQALDDNDWASIDFDLFDSDDPLFDHSEEARFAELREIINGLDRNETARIQLHQQAERLQGLQSVSDFNRAMREAGSPLRLTRFADQSWALDADGRLLFRIPRCSEARAVWCAALFERGMHAVPAQAPGTRNTG